MIIVGRWVGIGAAITIAVAIGAGDAQRALAETCASAPVSAQGEFSRFEWLAKTKARANWRRKVRLAAGLGPAYANWAKARDTEERCIEVQGRTYCIFTGTPCRP